MGYSADFTTSVKIIVKMVQITQDLDTRKICQVILTVNTFTTYKNKYIPQRVKNASNNKREDWYGPNISRVLRNRNRLYIN